MMVRAFAAAAVKRAKAVPASVATRRGCSSSVLCGSRLPELQQSSAVLVPRVGCGLQQPLASYLGPFGVRLLGSPQNYSTESLAALVQKVVATDGVQTKEVLPAAAEGDATSSDVCSSGQVEIEPPAVESKFSFAPTENHKIGYAGVFGNFRLLVEEDRWEEAKAAQDDIHEKGMRINANIWQLVIQHCIANKGLESARGIWRLVQDSKFQGNAFVGTHLIRMFNLLGSVEDANDVFAKLTRPNIYTWNAVIAANARHGQGDLALKLYFRMLDIHGEPDDFVFVSALEACKAMGSLEESKVIHHHISRTEYEMELMVTTALLETYKTVGSLDDVRREFETSPKRDSITWSAAIAAYAQRGHPVEALRLYQQMVQANVKPNNIAFMGALKACASVGALDLGKTIHGHIKKCRLESEPLIESNIIDMYAHCRSLIDAVELYQRSLKREMVVWNSMISGYAMYGNLHDAVKVFEENINKVSEMNAATYIGLQQACTKQVALEQGRSFQKTSDYWDQFDKPEVGAAIMDMYAKCGGGLDEIRAVFEKLPKDKVLSWCALISAHTHQGDLEGALQIFQQMQADGVKPDASVYANVVNACSMMTDLAQGKLIHDQVKESGLETEPAVAKALIDMYCKFKSFKEARAVFDKVSSTEVGMNAMMAGLAEHGQSKDALQFFKELQLSGAELTNIVYVSALKACARMPSLEEGKKLHEEIKEKFVVNDAYVCSGLIDMYSKCGCLEDACKVFSFSKWSVATCNAMLRGYVLHGQQEEAFRLFQNMQFEGLYPNEASVLALLKVCTSFGDCKRLHGYVIERDLEASAALGRAFITHYAHLAGIEEAQVHYETLPLRDTSTWNTWLAILAEKDFSAALKGLEDMAKETKPVVGTFSNLLNACSSKGFVDESLALLKCMNEAHSSTPNAEHYAYFANTLEQAGRLNEMEGLLEGLPLPANFESWATFLPKYKSYLTADNSFGHECVFDYERISDVYANVELRIDALKLDALPKAVAAWSNPGSVVIESEPEVALMRGTDLTEKIEKHKVLFKDGRRVVRRSPMSDKAKEDSLCGHCERLAISFGILHTGPGTTIRVDSYRIHHFNKAGTLNLKAGEREQHVAHILQLNIAQGLCTEKHWTISSSN
ncbi:hypothetical protein GOP47_0022104 [Adiantum capillus-veneris]|uniref:DYW domain-containing protein n=1 Tax=Adiantum capillus-veneris TaxID=13818 RepID=A0A9D4U939_ADICA|nr:hypothetical protein GOP47_0022104 [Adiantum capillus-veneris]